MPDAGYVADPALAAQNLAVAATAHGTTMLLHREVLSIEADGPRRWQVRLSDDETIDAEITGLVEQYQRQGLPGLTDVIISRSVRGEQGLYLLANNDRRVIAGNLDTWPQVQAATNGLIEFAYERRIGNSPELRRARGRIFLLQQGAYLLVARDVHERRELEALFTAMLLWGAGLMIVLGFAGGIIISRNFLTRLDVINRTFHGEGRHA